MTTNQPNDLNPVRKGLASAIMAAAFVLFASVNVSSGTVIFSDDFSEGTEHWTLTGSSSLDWNQSSEKFGKSMLFTGSAAQYNSAFSRMTANIGSQTLAVGESLSVSIIYHGLRYLNSNNTWFVLGFVDSAGFEGFVGGVRSTENTGTGALNDFYAVTGPSTKIGTGDGGNAALGGKTLVSGSVFNFNGIYDGEGGSTGNIDNVMQVTFSIKAQAEDELLLTTTYLDLNSSASYTSEILVSTTQNTFDQIVIGYQRRGAQTISPSFEIGSVNVGSIPEPSFYAALLGLSAAVLLVYKRRRA